MIITFCGHSKIEFSAQKKIRKQLLEILLNEVEHTNVDFYLGGYGDFDELAKECCQQFKQTNENATLYFVTPYENVSYLVSKNIKDYDDSIYPDIDSTPKKYAIVDRNKWMMRNSDLVIAYIEHNSGGAYKSFEYAKKLGKRTINLGSYQ